MAISKDQIFTAANQIVAEGNRPTLEGVRQITGGSYTTISPLLRQWKTEQQALDAPTADPVPEVISDRLARMGSELWSEALTLANSRLTAERDALETTRTEMQAEQAEAIELADKLSAGNDTLTARAQAAEDEAQRLRAELDSTSRDFSRYQSDSLAKLGQVEADRDQARQTLATETERREELRTDLLTERDQREQQAEQHRAEMDKVARTQKEQADQYQTEIGSLRHEVDEIRTARDTAARECAEARTDAKARAQNAEDQQVEIDRLNQALAQANQAAAEARENAADLGGQLKAAQQQIKQLTSARGKDQTKGGASGKQQR